MDPSQCLPRYRCLVYRQLHSGALAIAPRASRRRALAFDRLISDSAQTTAPELRWLDVPAPWRRPARRQLQFPASRFAEKHLGVTRRDHLATLSVRRVRICTGMRTGWSSSVVRRGAAIARLLIGAEWPDVVVAAAVGELDLLEDVREEGVVQGRGPSTGSACS